MFDRFKMEEQIMKVWSLFDLMDTVTEGVLEHNWTPDKVANAAIGIKELSQVEMSKLFDMFEEGIRLRKIE